MLNTGALYFCRADKFSDPFECSVPRKETDFRESEEHFRSTERVFKKSGGTFDKEHAKKQSTDRAATHIKIKRATTVNCWHINTGESDAMWQLYLKDNEGVAIKTTAGKLRKVLAGVKQQIGMSKVRYLDYENGIWFHDTEYPHPYYNFITPIFHKRLAFDHESELRLYHHDYQREKDGYWENLDNPKGELIELNVAELVEEIIFHPTSDAIAQQKVVNAAKKTGYNFKFQKSKMNAEPGY